MNKVFQRLPVAASPEKVMNALTGFERLSKFIGSIRTVTVSHSVPEGARVHWVLDFFGAPLTQDLEFMVREDGALIEFSAVSGDLEKYEGRFAIRPSQEGSEIEYHLCYAIGLPIEPYVAAVFQEKMVQFTEEMLEQIKVEVERETVR